MIVVLIAMPASLAIVDAWNDSISNEYETYIEYNNETRQITGALNDLPAGTLASSGCVYVHMNSTDVRLNEIQDLYDKSLFSDNNYRIVLSASDTTNSATYQDRLLLALNTTAFNLISAGANRMKLYLDAGKPVFFILKYQSTSVSADIVIDQTELNSTSNYTYTADIDIAKLLSLENTHPDGHFTLVILSYNETEELSPGDVVILNWQFLKKKGNVATIYTVDNLMLGWGAALFLIGFASTPFFNPLSRDVFPFITKMKRSRAARRAASKRKKSRKKGKSSKRSSKRKRRRR